VVVVLALFAAAAVQALAPRTGRPRRSPPPLVVVDPGHGGKDSGARHDGVREDDVNLAAGIDLAAALRRRGYRVVLTRTVACVPVAVGGLRPDPALARPGARRARCRINLRDRVLDSARRRASVFLSLHCDHYVDPSVRGPRTYYGQGSAVQAELAAHIQAELDRLRARPLAPIASRHFVLVSQPAMPAVTVELGFLTSPQDRALLATQAYRREIANAIVRGLDAYRREHGLTAPVPVDRTLVAKRWHLAHGA
jgi:N-acetylmuramoyl-L-alanine amidase